MPVARYSRRAFLHLAGSVAVSALAAACRAPGPTATPLLTDAPPTMTPKPSPMPTLTPSPNLQFDGGNADVWAWEAQVSGTLNAGLECSGVRLDANGASVAAALTGQTFAATIPISTGPNTVVAYCEGNEVHSRTLRLAG